MYLEGLCWNLKDLCKILKDLGLLDLCILGSHVNVNINVNVNVVIERTNIHVLFT